MKRLIVAAVAVGIALIGLAGESRAADGEFFQENGHSCVSDTFGDGSVIDVFCCADDNAHVDPSSRPGNRSCACNSGFTGSTDPFGNLSCSKDGGDNGGGGRPGLPGGGGGDTGGDNDNNDCGPAGEASTLLDCSSSYAVCEIEAKLELTECMNEDAWGVAGEICETYNLFPDGKTWDPTAPYDECQVDAAEGDYPDWIWNSCQSQCTRAWATGSTDVAPSTITGISVGGGVSLGGPSVSGSLSISTVVDHGGIEGACQAQNAKERTECGMELLECRQCVEGSDQ